MRRLLVVAVLLCAVAGCATLFGTDAYTDDTGVSHPATAGLVGDAAAAAKLAGDAGVPWAGLAGGVLGVIGTIGAFFSRKSNQRNLAGMVELFNALKPEIQKLASDKDLNQFIVKYAPVDSPFGKALSDMYDKLKADKLKADKLKAADTKAKPAA